MSTYNAKEKRKRKRLKAIDELLSTEKTYVNLLSKLVEHYVAALSGNTSILSTHDYATIFPADIHAILGLNQTFLEDLTKVIESSAFNNETSTIGDILISFTPHFKMYQHYCNNYSKAAQRLAKLRQKSSSAFSTYCDQQMQQTYFNRLNIESLIILPIQRMPRYKMLAEEIIKHTEPRHPDLPQLRLALSKISEVNGAINSRMKEFDSRIEVQNIENRFHGKLTNLVTPSRRFIKQGSLCKIGLKDDQDYIFVLFNDCLLYAAQSNGDKLTLGRILHFNSLFVVRATDARINVHNIEHLFEMQSTDESFMVYAPSAHEFDDWLQVIATTCAEHVALDTVKQQEAALDLQHVYARALYIPNDFADKCMIEGCNYKFSVVKRRHHCKFCGYVVCGKCSSNQLPARKKLNVAVASSTDMVRVCDVCYKQNTPATATATTATSNTSGGLTLPSKVSKLNKRSKSANYTSLEEELFSVLSESAAHASAAPPKSSSGNTNAVNAPSPSLRLPRLKSNKLLSKVKPAPPSSSSSSSSPPLSKESETLQQENASLKSENAAFKKQISALQRSEADKTYAYEQSTDKLRKQHDELRKDNERLQKLVDTLSSMTDEKKKSEQVQNTKLKTLEAHNQNVQRELATKEQHIQQLLSKISSLTEQQQRQQQQMETLHADLAQKNQRLQQQQQQQQQRDEMMDTATSSSFKSSVEAPLSSSLSSSNDSKSSDSPIFKSETIENYISSSSSASSSAVGAGSKPPPPSSKPPPPPRSGTSTLLHRSSTAKVLQTAADSANEDDVDADVDDRKEVDNTERVCATCGLAIVGRAFRTKGGLHHRACHVCHECKESLAGKPYGVTNVDGSAVKLCEECTHKANAKIRRIRSASSAAKRSKASSNLLAQMSQFRREKEKEKPTIVIAEEKEDKDEVSVQPKPIDPTLKPSIAASIAKRDSPSTADRTEEQLTTTPSHAAAASSKFAKPKPPQQQRKKNARRATSLMAQRKCAKCNTAIFGKNGVEGPNATVYHPNCFQCEDCRELLGAKKWREYPVHSAQKPLILCPSCARKRDEALFATHQGKLVVQFD